MGEGWEKCGPSGLNDMGWLDCEDGEGRDESSCVERSEAATWAGVRVGFVGEGGLEWGGGARSAGLRWWWKRCRYSGTDMRLVGCDEEVCLLVEWALRDQVVVVTQSARETCVVDASATAGAV